MIVAPFWRRAALGFPFTPAKLPGCVLWLRADLGVTLGTGVSAWADQSGSGNHAVQGTGSVQPPLVTSTAGLPAVRFNGSTQFMSIPAFALPAFTILAVHTVASASAFSGLFCQRVAGVAGFVLAKSSSTTVYDPRINVYNGTSETLSLGDANTLAIPVAARSWVFTSTPAIRTNGAAPATNAGGTGFSATSAFMLGQNGNARLGADVSELVVCNTVLSASEIAAWESYSRTRWGLY